MATFQAVFIPQNATSFTVTATTSSGDVFPSGQYTAASPRSLFAIQASGAINIRFGNSGMSNASAADWQISANQIQEFDLADQWDRIRIFNPGATSVTVWIIGLARC